MTRNLHPQSAAEAIAIQNELRRQVRLVNGCACPRIIAGIDVGYDPRRNLSKAALVIMDVQALEIVTSVIAYEETPFPYIPGLLSFREAPVILKALSCLKARPDLLMIDGHGTAHPRRLGIAAHIGVLSDIPSIGVGKSRLCGRYEEPGLFKGERSILRDKGEVIGTVLRSRDHVKPLIISPGHKIDLESAVCMTEQCLTKYRLPEPTRQADKLSKF